MILIAGKGLATKVVTEKVEVRAGPSDQCERYLRWLEGDTPAEWSDIDRTTFGGHPIVNRDYVAGFVDACRE